jgi:hypothetical protein
MNQKDHRNTNSDFPDWKIERFLLNELDETEMELIRRAAAENEQLRVKLESLERSNREIMQKYPADRMAGRILERLRQEKVTSTPFRHKPRPRIPRLIFVPAAIVAAITVAVFVFPHLFPNGDNAGTETTRLKGPAQQLHLYRKTASGSQQLRDGDRAAENDRVLLQYQTESHGYGAIISVDGWGAVTTHLPESGTQAAELKPGQARFLDYSYELDTAPRWEVFFFVTSPSDFRIETVTQAIGNAVTLSGRDRKQDVRPDPPRVLELPDNFQVTTFTLIKELSHED